MGRKAWLFAGNEFAGKCGHGHEPGAVGQAPGHDPWAYLQDVLARLQQHSNHRIDELLPHRWVPSA